MAGFRGRDVPNGLVDPPVTITPGGMTSFTGRVRNMAYMDLVGRQIAVCPNTGMERCQIGLYCCSITRDIAGAMDVFIDPNMGMNGMMAGAPLGMGAGVGGVGVMGGVGGVGGVVPGGAMVPGGALAGGVGMGNTLAGGLGGQVGVGVPQGGVVA